MAADPRVSILLITYNRAQFIEGAIESVFRQSFEDWELIIVDDSDTEIVQETVERFSSGDPRVRYFHREYRGTIANASNFGLKQAKGEYVAILDDDDWWIDSKKIEKQVAFLDEHQDYVGSGGGFEIISEDGGKVGKVIKPETDEAIRRVALTANPMANATTLFRRKTAEAVGGYDESFPQFADLDFWLSMGTQGKLYNFSDMFLAYRMWERGSSFKHQKENADAGWKIVLKHRNEYPGFLRAMILTGLYRVYARFPSRIRKTMNTSLSRLKKALFSG